MKGSLLLWIIVKYIVHIIIQQSKDVDICIPRSPKFTVLIVFYIKKKENEKTILVVYIG